MKHAIAAMAIAAASFSTPALAGSLSDPVVQPAVIMEDTKATGSSGAETMLLLIGIILVAAG